MRAAEMESGDRSHVARRKGSLAQTARAVFWSFFGVRKRSDYERDAGTLNPVHVIIMGIVGAVIFVLLLLLIVRFVVS